MIRIPLPLSFNPILPRAIDLVNLCPHIRLSFSCACVSMSVCASMCVHQSVSLSACMYVRMYVSVSTLSRGKLWVCVGLCTALRVWKAEVAVGLKKGQAEDVAQVDKDWWTSGSQILPAFAPPPCKN